MTNTNDKMEIARLREALSKIGGFASQWDGLDIDRLGAIKSMCKAALEYKETDK